MNYNVKAFLENLLDSIGKATRNIAAEVIIVDNASDDGSVEMLREKYPDINVIANDDNRGFSKANNQGLAVAKGKYMLLLNPDTLVQEDTFETMIQFFEENPQAGMAGCKVLNPDGTLQLASRRSFPGPWNSFCKLTGLSSIFPKSRLFARYNLTYLDENQTYEVDAISGSFMMLRREVYEKTGGLDERFFMYGEDLDWCYRVQKEDWKVCYVHTTQIIHYKGESAKRSAFNETRVFYDAMHRFVQKHYSGSWLVVLILRAAIAARAVVAFTAHFRLIILGILLDGLLYTGALFAADQFYSVLRPWKGFPPDAIPYVYTVPVLIYLLLAASFGAYRRDKLSVLRAFAALVTSFFVISATPFFFKSFAYSRGVVLLLNVGAFFLLIGWRVFVKFFFRIGFDPEYKQQRTVVVGTGEDAVRIASKLQAKYTTYHKVLGLVAVSRREIGGEEGGFPVIGSAETVPRLIRDERVTEVIFSSEQFTYHQMMSIVSACQREDVEFKVASGNPELMVGKTSVSLLDDIPLIELQYNISDPLQRFIKALFDKAFALFVLILLYPFIFLGHLATGKASPFKQFILNVPKVLRGEKSFVGPRDPSAGSLNLGKPGLTGIWFTEGGADASTEKLDIYYARNQNIWLDLEILGQTINRLVSQRKNNGKNST